MCWTCPKTVTDIQINSNTNWYRTNISVNKLSSEYGVSNVTIYKWVKDLSPVKVSDNETISAKQYKEMQKRIAQLEL